MKLLAATAAAVASLALASSAQAASFVIDDEFTLDGMPFDAEYDLSSWIGDPAQYRISSGFMTISAYSSEDYYLYTSYTRTDEGYDWIEYKHVEMYYDDPDSIDASINGYYVGQGATAAQPHSIDEQSLGINTECMEYDWNTWGCTRERSIITNLIVEKDGYSGAVEFQVYFDGLTLQDMNDRRAFSLLLMGWGDAFKNGKVSFSFDLEKIPAETGGGGAVGAVPEPAAWAMMIGGFGLAGAMLRRRRAFAA